MSYISLAIAFIMTLMDDAGVSNEAWLDLFLDKLVQVEHVFFNISFVALAIIIVAAIVIARRSALRKSLLGLASGIVLGCIGIFLLFLPVLEYVTWKLAEWMASAVDPTGIVNAGKFWVSAILFGLIGAG